MRFLACFSAFVFASCSAQKAEPPATGESRQSLVGVPQNSYPNYDERLQLVAQNRARSDPNSVAAGTAAACSTVLPVQPPLDYHYDISQAARFHSQFLMLNDCPLDHYSFCTLRADIEATACDGAAACACNGGECWPSPACDGNDNGCANSPGSRMSLFGYSGGTWGENGAAGYADSWDAVEGWVTECPPPIDPTEGHRLNVMSSSFNVVGTGSIEAPGGCWSGFFFSDYGSVGALAIPRIPSGVHRPEIGSSSTTFSFYANWYDPGGDPQSIDVVIDGVCHPMAVEIGTDVGNRTYLYQGTLPDGCREYYVVARDFGAARVTYPEVGSLLIEVGGGSCPDDYAGTRLPASCEAVIDGGVAPDLGVPDSGPSPDSASTPDQGTAPDGGTQSDSGPTLDAGFTPDGAGSIDASAPPDTGPTPDWASPADSIGGIGKPDEGRETPSDAGADTDGGEEVEISPDCSCAVGSRSDAGGGSVALGLLLLLCARSRRRAHPHRWFAAPGVAPCVTRRRTP